MATEMGISPTLEYLEAINLNMRADLNVPQKRHSKISMAFHDPINVVHVIAGFCDVTIYKSLNVNVQDSLRSVTPAITAMNKIAIVLQNVQGDSLTGLNLLGDDKRKKTYFIAGEQILELLTYFRVESGITSEFAGEDTAAKPFDREYRHLKKSLEENSGNYLLLMLNEMARYGSEVEPRFLSTLQVSEWDAGKAKISDRESQDIVQIFATHCQGMKRMFTEVKDLLYYESLTPEFIHFSIREFLNHNEQEFKAACINHGINVTIDDTSEYMIFSDPDYVRKILHNLLENAAKYTPVDRRFLGVQVIITQDDKHVYIAVKDHGIGMTSEELEQLQEYSIGFTTSKARNRAKGRGIGLPLVKLLTDKIHGEIQIESKPLTESETDSGSTFTLVVPMSQMYSPVENSWGLGWPE